MDFIIGFSSVRLSLSLFRGQRFLACNHLADDSPLPAFCIMRGRDLESILIDLAVSDADLLRTSFASLVAEAAIRTEGNVLFDIRVDGDPSVQRIAAIAFADAGVAFVLLANDGTHFRVVFPEEDLSDFTDPLSRWFALSLHERATTPFRGSAILLLGALRRCGHLDASS